MKTFPNLRNPFDLFASLFGIGLIAFAPGTFGSIFALILFIVLSHFINMFLATLIIFVLSIFVCNEVIKDLKVKDHKAIVIDELVGMWIALLPATYLFDSMEERITYAISALIFFRFFDILKVFPIYLIDRNLKNAFGIVLDDAIAGLFAIIPSFLILYLLF